MIGFHPPSGSLGFLLLLALLLLARPAVGGEVYLGVTRSDLGAGDQPGVVLGTSMAWEFAGSPFSLRLSLEYFQKGGEVEIGYFNSNTGEWEYFGWVPLRLSYLQAKICPEIRLFALGSLSASLYGGFGFGFLVRKSLSAPFGSDPIEALVGGIEEIDVVRVLGAKLAFQGLFLDLGWDKGLSELEGDPPLPGQAYPFSLDGVHNQSCHLALGFFF